MIYYGGRGVLNRSTLLDRVGISGGISCQPVLSCAETAINREVAFGPFRKTRFIVAMTTYNFQPP